MPDKTKATASRYELHREQRFGATITRGILRDGLPVDSETLLKDLQAMEAKLASQQV